MRRSKISQSGLYGGVPTEKIIVPPRALTLERMVQEDGDAIESFNRNTRQVQDIERKLKRKHLREDQIARDQQTAQLKQRAAYEHRNGQNARPNRVEYHTLGRTTPHAVENADGELIRYAPEFALPVDAPPSTDALSKSTGDELPVITHLTPYKRDPVTLDEQRVVQGQEPVTSTTQTRIKRDRYGVKLRPETEV